MSTLNVRRPYGIGLLHIHVHRDINWIDNNAITVGDGVDDDGVFHFVLFLIIFYFRFYSFLGLHFDPNMSGTEKNTLYAFRVSNLLLSSQLTLLFFFSSFGSFFTYFFLLFFFNLKIDIRYPLGYACLSFVSFAFEYTIYSNHVLDVSVRALFLIHKFIFYEKWKRKNMWPYEVNKTPIKTNKTF